MNGLVIKGRQEGEIARKKFLSGECAFDSIGYCDLRGTCTPFNTQSLNVAITHNRLGHPIARI
jgi:hypothetical protein